MNKQGWFLGSDIAALFFCMMKTCLRFANDY